MLIYIKKPMNMLYGGSNSIVCGTNFEDAGIICELDWRPKESDILSTLVTCKGRRHFT